MIYLFNFRKSGARVNTIIKQLSSILFFVLLAAYIYAFLFIPFNADDSRQKYTIADLWFNPQWTTDDAYQQSFQFHQVYHPELFQDDIITEMMTHYLTPLHYWLSYVITYATGDPILTGHWVMLIQFLLTMGFLGGALYLYSGSLAPAFFGITWLLHTRPVIQRLSCGLPRGWAGPVLTAFLFFLAKKSHKGIIITLFIGALVHPVSTFLAAITYGCYLLFEIIFGQERAVYKKKLLTYFIAAPFLIAVTVISTAAPDKLGSMATLETARLMPEFHNPGGRFPFVPLENPVQEILTAGFQAFYYRLHRPMFPALKTITPIFVVVVILAAVLLPLFRKQKFRNQVLVPAEILIYGAAAMLVYFLSRIFAFRLYVPDRHLQFPLMLFFIFLCTLFFWKLFEKQDSRTGGKSTMLPSVALLLLGGFLYLNSGTGFYGGLNFNSHIHKKGRFNEWLRDNTPITSVVGGHPVIVDATQLLAQRKIYISTETSHPFYDKYYQTIKPRYELSLRAHYSKDLVELYNLTKDTGMDYFVFWRKQFIPERLANARAFKPFDTLVKNLTSGDPENFAYRKLPAQDSGKGGTSPLIYTDSEAAIVDLKLLKKYLNL